jgi:hypothetical protein
MGTVELEGVKEWSTESGWRVMRIHYTANPLKRDKTWIDKARKSMPTDRWEREMEINFSRTEGTPVFQDFNDKVHIKSLEVNPYKPILRGWDFGRNRPRVVLAQKDNEDRLCVLREIVMTNVIATVFVQKVLSICGTEYKSMPRSDGSLVPIIYEDYADPSGYFKSDKDEKCTIEILNAYGIYPLAKENSIERGINIISNLLLLRKDNKPGLYINHRNCTLLTEAFMGGYVRATDGKPVKDLIYEDVMDALKYIVLNVYRMEETVPKDTEYSDDFDMEEELYSFDKKTGYVRSKSWT